MEIKADFLHQSGLGFMSLADRHRIKDFAYSRWQKLGDYPFHKEWRETFGRNSLFINELKELGRLFQIYGTPVVGLKGIVLVDDLYNNLGERSMSDVDLLIRPVDLNTVASIITQAGFMKRNETKWMGDEFKSHFTKTVEGIEMVIELHTDLFWHKREKSYSFVPSKIEGLLRLEPELELVHLIGHYSFQHTFLRLIWLFDIYLFIKKYHSQLNMQKVENYIESFGLRSSVLATGHVIQLIFNDSSFLKLLKAQPSPLLTRLITKEFVLYPKKEALRYHLVKAYLKSSFREGFRYYWAWLKHHVGLAYAHFANR